jgi:dUTP pyrophosphatase
MSKFIKDLIAAQSVKPDVPENPELPTISTDIPIKIKLGEGAKVPKYAHPEDSGFDIYLTEGVVLGKFKTRAMKTGLYMEIPEGYEVQIRPRSGVSIKTPFRIANSPGTIDSTYRGENKIIVQNVSAKTVYLPKGTKIAQGIVVPVYKAQFEVVDNLSTTDRGENGFGSTGE